MNGSLQLSEYPGPIMRRCALPILLTTLAVMPLCGCSYDTASRLVAAPDKYTLWTCAEMANEARTIADGQNELAALMRKAEVDAIGRFVSAQAYGSEYALLRGQMDQLRRTAAEKNCNLL